MRVRREENVVEQVTSTWAELFDRDRVGHHPNPRGARRYLPRLGPRQVAPLDLRHRRLVCQPRLPV
jgi:hypothetical protein